MNILKTATALLASLALMIAVAETASAHKVGNPQPVIGKGPLCNPAAGRPCGNPVKYLQ